MKRAGLSVIEQATWSLGSFAVSVLLGRSLGVDEFGLFALALVVLHAAGGFLNSLVLDPAPIVGPANFDDQLHRYGGLLLMVSMAAGLLLAAIGIGTWMVGEGEIAAAIGVGMLTGLPTFVSWTARRLPYLTSQPGHALAGSSTYLVGTVGGLYVWDKVAQLTVPSALLVLGLAAAAQAVCVVALWQPTWGGVRDRSMRRISRTQHWEYGRWFLAGETSSWILNSGFVGFSAAALSLGAAGGYRSSQVLMRPYSVVHQGLGMFLLPRYTRIALSSGLDGLVYHVRRVGILLALVAAAGFGILLFWGDTVMSLVFGVEFAEYGYVAAVMAGSMIVHAWIVATTMALTAAGYPRDGFFGQLSSAIVSIIAGLALGLSFGLTGLLVAMWLAVTTRAIVIQVLFRIRHRAELRSAAYPK